MLPINQVRNGQRRPLKPNIEPTAEVVQPHFGRQAGWQATQHVGPLVFQADPSNRRSYTVSTIWRKAASQRCSGFGQQISTISHQTFKPVLVSSSSDPRTH